MTAPSTPNITPNTISKTASNRPVQTDSLAEQRTWQVSDTPFNPFKQHHLETIYTVGNGYMGVRGTFEETYPDNIASTLVHGVYNHSAGELVPDIVNFPNPLHIVIEVDGEAFHMDQGEVLGYRRTLNVQDGTLTREVIWHNSKGKVVKLRFVRFASLAMDELLVQAVTIRALDGDCTINVRSWIDGDVKNFEGGQHLTELQASAAPPNIIALTAKTNQSGYELAVASALVAPVSVRVSSSNRSRQPMATAEIALRNETEVTLVKYSALHSTRRDASPLMGALGTLAKAQSDGYDKVCADNAAEWQKYWRDSDIVITGDEVAQRAMRFCTYHVLIAAPRNDQTVSIGAKTLSGPGYKGHVFWDTELFILPTLTVTQPQLARNLLMYRYNNLAGARNKASKAGFQGAMFPWESTDTGEETTPQWTHPLPDGSRIRIWTGDNEQHISTDIAYAIMQYWNWTGDDTFFVKYGAEMVLDTAVFWGSRVEHNAEHDRYELSMQIGPDEYHDNINNSAFTNRMVRWHLQTAIKVGDWLLTHDREAGLALLEKLKIDSARIAQWKTIAEKMYVPYSTEHQVLEQFDGFMKLQRVDLKQWQPRVTNYDAVVGHARVQNIMVIKQADVVMLMSLLGDSFGTEAERQRNYDFYAAVCDHGSSLSRSTHALVASRLNMIAEAYNMFIYAANIDIDDIKGNVRDGIHAAASGGVWQALVFGFCGVTLDGETFKVDPKLPAHWQSVTFRLKHRGVSKLVTITQDGTHNEIVIET